MITLHALLSYQHYALHVPRMEPSTAALIHAWLLPNALSPASVMHVPCTAIFAREPHLRLAVQGAMDTSIVLLTAIANALSGKCL